MQSADRSSRDRLLDTALTLFADRGYAATSTAEIQKACGMSPGSGALYRHFRSKNDVLRAALRRGLDRMRNSQSWRQANTPADRLETLNRVAEAAKPDAAPDLVDELWVGNLAFAHTTMGRALRATANQAGTEINDPEAIGAVLLAALSYGPVMQILLGRTPGDMDPDRFRDAWLRLSRAVFTHGVPAD